MLRDCFRSNPSTTPIQSLRNPSTTKNRVLGFPVFSQTFRGRANPNLKSEGKGIIGIEVTDKSTDLQHFDFCDFENIVLLFGSERYGIQDIELLDASIAIPMYGHNTSMNVVHSMAICLYEATNQLKKLAVKEMPF